MINGVSLHILKKCEKYDICCGKTYIYKTSRGIRFCIIKSVFPQHMNRGKFFALCELNLNMISAKNIIDIAKQKSYNISK